MHEPDRFSARHRTETIDKMSRTLYDIVIIGGGITGCGAALDAASRGLRVALLEQSDLASGTSSRSAQMVHGGLRYLDEYEFGLVYQALQERQRLLHNAPHLVREVDFLAPIRRGDKLKYLMPIGLTLYDAMGGFRIGKVHKRIGAAETAAQMSTLDSTSIDCGFYYPDARTDDARLTMYLALSASTGHQADVATYTAVGGLEKDASGRVRAVVATDAMTGRDFTIQSRYVVNATGVWSDGLRKLDRPLDHSGIRPTKGIHIVVDRARVRNLRAMSLWTTDNRPFYVMPWGARAYIGTTDTNYEGALDDPNATPEDIEYLIDSLNSWLIDPIDTSDVIATWAGLRPLVDDPGNTRATSTVSRRMGLAAGSDGFVTITGGKLTTYRAMAAKTIDFVIERGDFGQRKCATKKLLLSGAQGFAELVEASDTVYRFLDRSTVSHLLGRHGSNTSLVVRLIRDDPTLGLRLIPDLPYVRAEVVHAVRHELCETVADMIERRSRIAVEDRARGLGIAREVSDLMGDELSWDQLRRNREVDDYKARVAQTLASEAVTTPPDRQTLIGDR